MSIPPIPRHVDLRKLAAAAGVISGTVPLASLERLAGECEQADTDVSVMLECGVDEENVRFIRGTVETVMPLQCQRCLGTVGIAAKASPMLAMVWSEEQIPDLPRRYDGVVVGAEPSDLFALIEDELLLCLPLAPRHEEGECSALSSQFGDAEPEPAPRENPFAVLGALKKSER